MKKIAIMGARGFEGKALTAHLQDKAVQSVRRAGGDGVF